ncbi:MAG: PIN domain-containing protein [Thermodesulfovibrionales bacterium]|nr:PIN domain-containing protein [Thermodesulfovibrionales bacterium]
MKAVIDSNIIFSAIISGKQFYIDIIQSNEFYTPDIVFIELEKYETRIIEKSRFPIEDFRKFVRMLFEKIVVIPKMAISKENWQKAYNLCKGVDEKDTPFIALSIELSMPLWTNDKSLTEGLKTRNFNQFISTEQLMSTE